MNKEKQAYYLSIADHLENRSEDICKDNDCTEENHNCESYAYFDKVDDTYILATICHPDYCQRSYDSMVGLPFSGNAFDLFSVLESNDSTD